MVTKKTVSIYRPSGSYLYMVRIPKLVVWGICLIWSMEFQGTREECVNYCEDKYQIPWWKWPWNADKIIYGQS